MIVINVLYATVLVSLPYITWLPVAGRACYAIWIPLLFSCVAGNTTIAPFAVIRSMGRRHVASIYGVVFSASVGVVMLVIRLDISYDGEVNFSDESEVQKDLHRNL